MSRLADKAALITDAARGVGPAFAAAYLREGARVDVVDINIERARASAAELGEAAIPVEMDVTRQDSIENAVAETMSVFGRIDILVNNAALFDLAPIADITRESYEKVFSVNVAGVLFTLQVVARVMIDHGQVGRIINVASQAGRRGEALVAVFCASKSPVISLAKSAALNLVGHRINVNAIAPGVVEGAHWDGVDALFARYEGRPPGEKKAAGRRGSALWPHGAGRGPDRNGGLPGELRERLCRQPNLQRRWRKLVELRGLETCILKS